MVARHRDRKRELRVAVVFGLLAFLTLLVGIVWAAMESGIDHGMQYLLAERWGVVTLIDIYVGAVIVALWMWVWERNRLVWLGWVLGLVFLGHLVTALYFLRRVALARNLAEVFAPQRM